MLPRKLRSREFTRILFNALQNFLAPVFEHRLHLGGELVGQRASIRR